MEASKNTISVKQHIWNKKLRYGAGLLIFLLLSIIAVMIPAISGRIVDGLKMSTMDLNDILILCLQILGFAASTVLCNFFARVLILRAANEYGRDSRNKVFEYLLKLSMKYYNKNSVGDIMALSTNDLRVLRMSIMRTTMMIGRAVFTVILSTIAMVTIATPKLALIVMLPMPIVVFVTFKIGPILRRKFKNVQGAFADLTTKTQENVSGIRVIKAFVQEEEEIKNFEKVNEANFQANKDLVKSSALFHPVLRLLTTVSFLLLFAAGGSMVIKNVITVGDYVASVQYIGNMIRPFAFLGMMVEMIQRARASLARLNEFFYEPVDIKNDADTDEFIKKNESDRIKGSIEFNNLSFKYDENQDNILSDISLKIEPGQTLGIIGKIGSGKSTLAQLMMRLYHVQSGMLKIDGINVDEIPVDILRRNIGYIPQMNYLFSDTIGENIGFSPREINIEEVYEYAKLAQIYDSIMECENGFDTKLGERGVNLSGGQKQRISIARALYRKPSILIVDDALSAVDTETESKILEGLKPYTKDITTLIIAHRVSTIEHSDIIIVLEDGFIIEKGSHEKLMKLKGHYYDIYQRQQLESLIEGGEE